MILRLFGNYKFENCNYTILWAGLGEGGFALMEESWRRRLIKIIFGYGIFYREMVNRQHCNVSYKNVRKVDC